MADDVRMKGFGEQTDLDAAVQVLAAKVVALPAETLSITAACGRVLAEDVTSTVDVPAFDRSAVDGYAVIAQETFGAQPLSPIELELVGESMPGRTPDVAVGAGQACRIMTGAPMPAGADAVVMAEDAEERDPSGGEARGRVRITGAVPPGKNCARRGEDIEAGGVVLARGRRLRPHDLGVLASMRRREVRVHRVPRVALFSSGNELVDPFGDQETGPGQIYESNGVQLEALVREEGAVPDRLGILRDSREQIRDALQDAVAEHEVIVTTGAASVGREDFMPLVVAELGELWVHGVSIRPAHPVGFGRVGERLAFMLPGNPVAVFVGFWALLRPALRLLAGRRDLGTDRTTNAPLARKVASRPGRTDFVRVRLGAEGAEPIGSGGAGALTNLTRADGFIVVPRDREGIEAGETVEVVLI